MHINFLNIVKVGNLGVRSGARSNLKVEWHRPKIFYVPLHFSEVPLHVRGHYRKCAARPRDESLASSLTIRRAI